MKSKILIGTRGSALAMYQAELAKTLIENDFPMVEVHRVKIKTSGDMVRRGTVHPLETKRMFTREIEEALLAGEVDLAVHSAKDMAVPLPEGTKIGAVLEREDPRDCLISKDKKKISELALGSRIGTSSLRRKKQLERMHPDLVYEDVRGNVDTRIRKVEEGHYDAVVLAYAGIKRLGLESHIADIFPEESVFPAPGQGVIVVQSRVNDPATDEILTPLNHADTEKRLLCERAFLKRLEGGCQLPCGISTRIQNGTLKAKGALFAVEGSARALGEKEGPSEAPEKLGVALAELILAQGGREILDKIRHAENKKT